MNLIKLFPDKTKYEKILEEDEIEKEIIIKINEGKSSYYKLSNLLNIKSLDSKFVAYEENVKEN